MATITRLMTTLDAGTANTNWDDLSGATFGNANTETGPAGSGATSLTEKISKAVEGFLYDDGATGTFASGDHLCMWYFFLFGALDTQAGGGIRFRLCGNTVTDFAEVFIDGNDSGKSGWQMAVVSIDRILANPDNVGGTAPTTAASIRYAGIVFDVTATVGGNNDNCGIQAIHHIPAGTSCFRIEGDGGSADVTWADIASGVLADAGRGIVVLEPNGTFTLRGPLVIGDGTTSTQDTNLSDTGVALAWDNQVFIEPEFYGMTAERDGTSNDVTIVAGTKIGSGADAVGVNGWTILSGGPRWFLDFEDADMADASVGLYGCNFSGSADWTIDDIQVEMLSCVLVDCGTMELTVGTTGPVISKNFFSACPGPRAQIVIHNTTSSPPDFAANQFIENSFVNMTWFALEFEVARDAGYTLNNFTFSNNGTLRDVLATHDGGETDTEVLLNVTGGGDSPQVTNGSKFNITMGGTPDVFLYTVATWEEVQTAAGTDVNDSSGTLSSISLSSFTVDDDSFTISAARVPAVSEILYDGTGDDYTDDIAFDRDIDFLSARIGYPDVLTPGAGDRTAFPSHSETETESVQSLVRVTAANAATVVALVDPEFRPWTRITGASSETFGYGAGFDDGTTETNDLRKMFLIIVALDSAAAGDTSATATMDTSGGTQALTVRDAPQDDNTGGGGSTSSLEITVLELSDETASLNQGTTDVQQNVTTSFTNIRSDSEIRIYDTGTTNEVSGDESVGGNLIQVAINDGGTGYAVNDVLTLVGGTGTAATVTVDAVSGGVITEVSITTGGDYTEDPPSPNSPTVAPAGGTGALLDIRVRGTHDFTFNAATQGNFDVVVHHLDFVYFRQNAQVPDSADGNFQISQVIDRNFDNPA